MPATAIWAASPLPADERSTKGPPETLSAKGRQTRDAIEQAARQLFAERGFHGTTLSEHTAAAIALLFENFTTVFVGTSGLDVEIGDEDAIATLSRIWKKTLYGF